MEGERENVAEDMKDKNQPNQTKNEHVEDKNPTEEEHVFVKPLAKPLVKVTLKPTNKKTNHHGRALTHRCCDEKSLLNTRLTEHKIKLDRYVKQSRSLEQKLANARCSYERYNLLQQCMSLDQLYSSEVMYYYVIKRCMRELEVKELLRNKIIPKRRYMY